ncbi:MAG TPA: hypothetical protein VKY90_09720 [Candidatus Dormibacteraeota bacterium]|nr:hypothetical protein [Candidatus Dormibacteraeota bacterium]
MVSRRALGVNGAQGLHPIALDTPGETVGDVTRGERHPQAMVQPITHPARREPDPAKVRLIIDPWPTHEQPAQVRFLAGPIPPRATADHVRRLPLGAPRRGRQR